MRIFQLLKDRTVELISTSQACELLGISRTTMWRRVESGAIPEPRRVGNFRQKYFDRSDIETYRRFNGGGQLKSQPQVEAGDKQDRLLGLVTIAELCAALSISKRTVYRMIDLGTLPRPRSVGSHRRKYFVRMEVAKAIKRQRS